jgi:hypothetical protein
MPEKRGVYKKKVQFARMFLVGFERSKVLPPELFILDGKSKGKAGCWFVHHCFYAFDEIFLLDGNASIKEMIGLFKQMPHIRKCLCKIAKCRNNSGETVLDVIKAGQFSETKISSELTDYTVWIEYLDAEYAKKSKEWVTSHPVSIGAWLLLFLSTDWWEKLEKSLEQRRSTEEMLWKNSVLLTYRIATETKFSETEETKKKIVEHETIKPYMARMARVYPQTIQILNALVSKLEPLAPKPKLGQAALKRIYLEYQFLGQDKGVAMETDGEKIRAWVIDSFERMSKGQDPKDTPPVARESEVEQVIKDCHNELEKHWETPLIKRGTNFENSLSQHHPQQNHLEFALRIDTVIAGLELPKTAIDAILGIYDMVTGQRFIDQPVFASSEIIVVQIETPATQFEQLLKDWKSLSQRLEQPAIGIGWFSEFFDLMAELQNDELEQVFPDFATENPTG